MTIPPRYLLLAFVLSSLTLPLFSQIQINEILARNNNGLTDPQGNNEDWVEIYNAGSSPVDLAGYYFSDDPLSPAKWQIPAGSPTLTTVAAGGYLILWADGDVLDGADHLGFSLQGNGEFIGIFQQTGPGVVAVDSFSFGAQYEDISYGRSASGGQNMNFFEPPTPGSANANLKALPPSFSQERGFYTQDFLLTLSDVQSGSTIYYTLDGSEPDPANLLGKNYTAEVGGNLVTKQVQTFQYSGPFWVRNRASAPNDLCMITPATGNWWNPPQSTIFKGTIVRAAAVIGGQRSDISTHTYMVHNNIIGHYKLPIVSIVSSPDSIFDYNYGIYVPGAGNSSGNPNYNNSWERTSHVEFFDEGGNTEFFQNCGIRIHGNISRTYGRKSVRLYARNEYDAKNTFDYAFFPGLQKRDGSQTDIDEFKRIIMRNSGNNWAANMYHDAFIQHLYAPMGLDFQASRAVLQFINGEYWGLMNMRERQDWNYLSSHYGLAENEVVILDKSTTTHGQPADYQHYTAITSYARVNDMRQQAHWEYINTQIDIESYINFYVAHIYASNSDFIQNNHRRWRKRVTYSPNAPYGHDGRWRYFFFDCDHGFKPVNINNNKLTTVLNDQSSHARLFQNLAPNTTFQRMLINTFADHMNTTMDSVRARVLLDSMQAEMQPDLIEHKIRWRQLHYSNLNKKNDLLSFIQGRTAIQQQHIISTFAMATGTDDLTLDVSSTSSGNVQINSVFVDENTPGVSGAAYPWTGTYFSGVPVTLQAIPKPGYRFVRWQGLVSSTNDSIEYIPSINGTITALFVPDPTINSLKINEFMSDNSNSITDPQGQFEDWIEIYNNSSNPVNLAGLYITDDLTNPGKWQIPTTNPSSTEVPAGGFLILWADNDPGDGPSHLGFKLGKGGEDIGLYQLANGTYLPIDQLSYSAQNTDEAIGRCGNGGSHFFTFSLANTTPGTSNGNGCPIVPSPGITGIHINEIQAANTQTISDPQGQFEDWIEIYNSGTAPVDLGGVYFTDNPVEPFKWQIPTGQSAVTTVAAGSYLVFWADKDTLDGPLHLDFSLSQAGEYVGIFQNISGTPVPISELFFGPQVADESFGAFPDGSSTSVFFQTPTPNATNIVTNLGFEFLRFVAEKDLSEVKLLWEVSSSESVQYFELLRSFSTGRTASFESLAKFDGGDNTYFFQDPLSSVHQRVAYKVRALDFDGNTYETELRELWTNSNSLKVYPNPSRGRIKVAIPNDIPLAKLHIYDSKGRTVFQEELSRLSTGEILELELEHLPVGVYLLQLQSSTGLFTTKIVLE